MVDFAELWETINDKCWPIAEAVKLDDFFDENNIPPVILPLAALLIILVLIFAFMGGGPGPITESICGDGICAADEECPDDCDSSAIIEGGKVLVFLESNPSCSVEVKLFDSTTAELKGNQNGQTRQFTFTGIDATNVYVEVRDDYGAEASSASTTLQWGETVIELSLGDDFCEPPVSTTGILRLSLVDSKTNTQINSVTVSIVKTQNDQIVNEITTRKINGAYDFTLPFGTYTVMAEREGYEFATSSLNLHSKIQAQTISMKALPPGSPETGDIEVCAKNENGPMSAGLISLQGISSDYFATGDLSSVDSTMETTFDGCYVFEQIPAGTHISVSMATAPEGCVPVASPTATVESGGRELINLTLDCLPGDVGYLKVRIIGNNNLILTDNATITLWTIGGSLIPGHGLANSLARGEDNYTEEVTVPADTTLYVWARGMPHGYLDVQSQTVSLSSGVHEVLDIYLNYTELTSMSPADFQFLGVASPSLLSKSEAFTATINQIMLGELEMIADIATLNASLNSQPCDAVFSDIWRVYCLSPNMTGQFDLQLSVIYEDLLGEYEIPIEVREYGGAGNVLITPTYSTYDDPPLDLFYMITIDGEIADEMASQNITVKYLDSEGAYAGEISDLSYLSQQQIWVLTADVPFKGDYQLEMELEVFKDDVFYPATYIFGFTATTHSSNLAAEVIISDDLLMPSEEFLVDVILTFNGKTLPNLEILEVFMDDVFYTIPWETTKNLYSLPLSAPPNENCKLFLQFIINDEKVAEAEFIRVIDTLKTKSTSCPMSREASCSSIEDVRKCLFDQEARTSYYAEAQIQGCVESGCGLTSLPQCNNTRKGDLEPDCVLDEVDLDIMENWLTSIRSQPDRNLVSACTDMDNDGDFDEADELCLTKIISTAWKGDVGNSNCPASMKGGFCFDMDLRSSLPGDLYHDNNLNEDDSAIMSKIIRAASKGVTPNADILFVADFNRDNKINSVDKSCLEKFFAVDFQSGTSLMPTQTIPVECMKIFDMGCAGVRGDLDKNQRISTIDYIILKFIVDGSLSSSGVSQCADINHDDLIDEQDLFCMESYMSGDMSRWLSCLNCDQDLPEDAFSEGEICNDGYDNNCDGKIDEGDPGCVCGTETLCAMTWDIDGGTSPGIKDGGYTHCLNVSWEADTMTAGNAQFRMISPQELDEKCTEDTWGDKNTYKCFNGTAMTTYTCNFKYEAGFTYPDTVEDGNFGWQEGFGNIGPVGTTYRCDSYTECADGWEKVEDVTREAGCCNHCSWTRSDDHDRCRVCRFEYDHCDKTQCGTSGDDITAGRCSDAFTTYREICPEGTEGECMGQLCPSGCSYGDEVTYNTEVSPVVYQANGVNCPCGLTSTCGGIDGCYSCIPAEECPLPDDASGDNSGCFPDDDCTGKCGSGCGSDGGCYAITGDNCECIEC